MRHRLSLAVALTASLGSGSASGEEVANARSLRLEYRAPVACPPRTWFEGSLRFRSSRLSIARPDEAVEYEADVVVEEASEGFRGSLIVGARGGTRTRRELQGAACATVVDALGFTIALLLDPENVNTAALPPEAELARLAERAPAGGPPSTPEAAIAPPPSVASPVSRGQSSSRAGLGLFVELGGGAWTAVRGVTPRGHLMLEVRREGARLGLFGRIGGLVAPADVASSAAGTISYFPSAGRIDGGASWRLAADLRAAAGVLMTTLIMPVDAPTTDDPRPSLRVVPSLGSFVRASWEPSSVGLALELGGGVHVPAERFRVESSGVAREVFRLPPVWGQATIGVVVRFVDPGTVFER